MRYCVETIYQAMQQQFLFCGHYSSPTTVFQSLLLICTEDGRESGIHPEEAG